MKVMILQGLPGSGKTFFAKEFCEKNLDWIRVCRDDLRNMRGKYWLPKQEDIITDMEIKCMEIALAHGKNVIIDATNFNTKYLERLKEDIKAHEGVEYETKFFDTPLEKCIENDLRRPNSVGEKVIRKFYDKYLKPKTEPIKQNFLLTHAIICDLDGTLSKHNENFVPNTRNIYDYGRVYEDVVNDPIAKILHRYVNGSFGTTVHLIFVSGREDSCRVDTTRWLDDKVGLPKDSYSLHMRKSGDRRKDCIVKKEIFDAEIKDKYYVEFVLDDRDQVVEFWRSMGLTCLQVADGDF